MDRTPKIFYPNFNEHLTVGLQWCLIYLIFSLFVECFFGNYSLFQKIHRFFWNNEKFPEKYSIKFMAHSCHKKFLPSIRGEKQPVRKNLHPLFERLASLGIIGAQLTAHLKPLDTMVQWWFEQFQGGPQFNSSLSESYTSSRCSVSSPGENTGRVANNGRRFDFPFGEVSFRRRLQFLQA